MSTETTLCIVGAGIAGLSAGICGQLSGSGVQVMVTILKVLVGPT